MDRICGEVLARIHALSPAGRYVIIDENEFFEAFPDGSDRTYAELERVLSYLKSGGYIDLKYSRGDMYCVAPLKEYVEPPPALVPATHEIAEPRVRKLDNVFIAAFAGGALGSLIISLIFALL